MKAFLVATMIVLSAPAMAAPPATGGGHTAPGAGATAHPSVGVGNILAPRGNGHLLPGSGFGTRGEHGERGGHGGANGPVALPPGHNK